MRRSSNVQPAARASRSGAARNSTHGIQARSTYITVVGGAWCRSSSQKGPWVQPAPKAAGSSSRTAWRRPTTPSPRISASESRSSRRSSERPSTSASRVRPWGRVGASSTSSSGTSASSPAKWARLRSVGSQLTRSVGPTCRAAESTARVATTSVPTLITTARVRVGASSAREDTRMSVQPTASSS